MNTGFNEAQSLLREVKGDAYLHGLAEVAGFSDAHIERALAAAKNPQLKMKLENMPVALTAEMVDAYMGPVLQAARNGDLSIIRNVA